MADNNNLFVVFSRPVRVNKTHYGAGTRATLNADMARRLIEIGAAKEAEVPTKKEATPPAKKD